MREVVCKLARWPFVAVVTTFFLLAPSNAPAQTWDYRIYSTKTGQYLTTGYITLEEKEGVAIVRITAAESLSRCIFNELKATVVKTDLTTTITTAPPLRGCDEVRLVIRNDGTGGRREVRTGSDWIWDGLDHGLTPRK